MDSYFLGMCDFWKFNSTHCRTVHINLTLGINPATYNSLCLILP